MPVETDVKVGDVGTTLRATIVDGGSAVDVSGATTKEIILKKPDGTTVRKTAAFTNSGTDGKIEYVTQDGDIDQAGTWRIAGYVELPGWSGTSETETFDVQSPLDAAP